MPRSFSNSPATVPLGLSWLLATALESRGRQDLFESRRPEVLRTLRETALVQSAESSNRLEGVVVSRERLTPLVLGDATARDRPEEEIVGYRRALRWIHEEHDAIAITTDTLRELHRKAQQGMIGDAGDFRACQRAKNRNNESGQRSWHDSFKRIDNDIIEFDDRGTPRLRFRTVAADEVAERTEHLVMAYQNTVARELVPPLLAEASFVFDFLCIHPFRDGNGRVARLLTLLLIYKRGFRVGRYISLERIVEETKVDYYDALYRSSQGWHEGAHDIVPWWSYFLSVIRQAYRDLEERIERAPMISGGKSALVLMAVAGLPQQFSFADVERACPGVSAVTIRRVLRGLRDEGQLQSSTGRASVWQKRS